MSAISTSRTRTRSPLRSTPKSGSARQSRREMGKKLGDTTDPLLLSVRSGAKFSMPGMMNTILNLGLNDVTTAGAGEQDRQSALRLRLLPPLHPDVRRSRARHVDMEKFDQIFDARKAKRRSSSIPTSPPKISRPSSKTTRSWSRRKPASRSRRIRTSSSPCPATPCSAPGGTPKAIYYRKMEKHSGRHRHRRQRAGHGVRQHGRYLGHRRRLHARSRHRREECSTASS